MNPNEAARDFPLYDLCWHGSMGKIVFWSQEEENKNRV